MATTKTSKKHWNSGDFVVTYTSPAYDGSATVNRFGYCRKCKCDMQAFASNGKVLHYKSHSNAKRAGAWH